MKRSIALRNSGFANSLTYMDRDQRIAARSARMANIAEIRRAAPQVARGVMGRVIGCAQAVPKDAEPVRSEAYRRLVATLPCVNCGVEGYSQAAHPPATARSRKEDDRLCVPLCGPRVGIDGCHRLFDTMRLVSGHARRGQMLEWAQKTQTQIRRMGLWPKNLPNIN